MGERERFLHRIRSAVADARREGAPEPTAAWMESGPRTTRSPADLLDMFKASCRALPVGVRTAKTDEGVREHLLAVLREEGVRTYVAWRSPSLEQLCIPGCLDPQEFMESLSPGGNSPKEDRSAFKAAAAAADAGITGAQFGLADTGTLVVEAGPGRERSLSLLPPVHVAVLRAENILESTADLLSGPLSSWSKPGPKASNITLITGASKTADIEMELVHGVHGPGRLYVILRV